MPWPFTPGGLFGPEKPKANPSPSPFVPPPFDVKKEFGQFAKGLGSINAPARFADWAGSQSRIDQNTLANQINYNDFNRATQQRNRENKVQTGLMGNAQSRFNIETGDLNSQRAHIEDMLKRSIAQGNVDLNYTNEMMLNALGGIGTDRAQARRERDEAVRNLAFDASSRGASRSVGLTQDTETQESILAETLDRLTRREFETRTTGEKEMGDIRRAAEKEIATARENQRGLDVQKELKKLGLNDDYIRFLSGMAERQIEQKYGKIGLKLNEKDLKAASSQVLFEMIRTQSEMDSKNFLTAAQMTTQKQREQLENARSAYEANQNLQFDGNRREIAPGAGLGLGGGGGRSW